ncbi:hypothetical protein Q9L58_010403 [Maublancomyces gigas]|uniref:Uncharacterized protein n=1 Tax=Discina gigas TaxID=1032678 RepID=A0ABR3G479_9PEZI
MPPVSLLEVCDVILTRVAVSNVGDTKKALTAAIRAAGLPGNLTNVARGQELRENFDAAHRQRRLHQANTKAAKVISALPVPFGRPAILLPLSTPAMRLTELHTTSDVAYTIDFDRNFDVYRGAYKGWGANVDMHQIRVPALAMLVGLTTLDALPMEAPAGIELYAAVWASQARGYAVKTDRGFIAVAGAKGFHSDTAEGAISGLRHKGRHVPTGAAQMADMKSAVEAFIIKFPDARTSGSCEYGIRSWCASVDVDIARVQVPMAELLKGFRHMPQTEVRRAVLRAVRRNRVSSAAQYRDHKRTSASVDGPGSKLMPACRKICM